MQILLANAKIMRTLSNPPIKGSELFTPLFYVRTPNGELKMQAVWAKSCRGAMVRYILQNELVSPEELNVFSHKGFEYNPNIGEDAYPHFVRELT